MHRNPPWPLFLASTANACAQRALGLEISEVTSLDEEREVKSVSNERTFAKDLTERGDIEAAIALLGESVGRRLRRQGLRRHGDAQA